MSITDNPRSNTMTHPRSHCRSALAPFLIWAPSLCVLFYAKFAYVRWDGFFLLAQLQRLESMKQLSLLDKGLFFLPELSIASIVLLLTVSLSKRSSRKTKLQNTFLFIQVLLSLLVALLIHVQLQSYYSLGRFTSYAFLTAALHFVLENSRVASDYIVSKSTLKLLSVLLAIILAVPLSHGIMHAVSTRARRVIKPLRFSYIAVLSIIAICSTVWYFATPLRTPAHRGILPHAIRSFLGITESNEFLAQFEKLDTAALVTKFENLTLSKFSTSHTMLGKAKHYSVIFFVFETAPYSLFSTSGSELPDFKNYPTMQRLAANSLVATHHYSTYPITNRAIFSMLTAWYPSSAHVNFTALYPYRKPPSLLHALREKGYQSAFFTPTDLSWEQDDRMLFNLGFDSIHSPNGTSTSDSIEKPSSTRANFSDIQPSATGEKEDRYALELMKAEIVKWNTSGTPYIAFFAPQLGHGPWTIETGATASIDERGRQIVRTQDTWLSEIIQLLEANGTLERTLLVITSDHGIRTTQEHPQYRVGFADELSYRVPFLLYNKGIFPKQVPITTATSHIDITPTLLELLGVNIKDKRRQSEQGIAMWNPIAKERTLFLFGRHFIGVDALISKDHYAMHSYLRFSDCESYQRLHFTIKECRVATQKTPLQVRFETFSALQSTWMQRFSK